VGTALLALGVVLLAVAYGCQQFATENEDRAQYNRKLSLLAQGVPSDEVDEAVEDVEANLLPTYLAAAAAVSCLLVGALLRMPFREPQTEMTSLFFGAAGDGGQAADEDGDGG